MNLKTDKQKEALKQLEKLFKGLTPKPPKPNLGSAATAETKGTIMSKTPWYTLMDAALKARVYRTSLEGPPGFGKSWFGRAWAESQDPPWKHHKVNLTPVTDYSELVGHYMIQENNFVWADGYITRAWNESHEDDVPGVIIQLEEISHAGPDCQSTLHNVLDDEDSAVLHLPTGEKEVKRVSGEAF